jgi:FtsH-binding integral membrane protein
LIILQFGLILAIGTVRAWAQEADNLSLGLLFVYAGVTGLVLAPVSSLYLATVAGQGLVIKALGSATVTFGAAAAYGWITKRDLSSWGGILTMGVLGLILSSLLNVFWLQSSMTDLVLSGISVLIFTAFTAYDLNMAKENRYNATAGQIALGLYLNFLNLFLAMLRLFSGGDRR